LSNANGIRDRGNLDRVRPITGPEFHGAWELVIMTRYDRSQTICGLPPRFANASRPGSLVELCMPPESSGEDPPDGASCPVRLLIGRDAQGRWVVREENGLCGGLFVSHDEAARYARDESLARLPRVTVVVAVDSLELEPIFSASPRAA
jgi:hypothetical protein